jgi:antitoxin VapB
VERLAAEVARRAGETRTEAIRRALRERRARLTARDDRPVGSRSLVEFLGRQIRPFTPPEAFGGQLSREEEDNLPGYGPRDL